MCLLYDVQVLVQVLNVCDCRVSPHSQVLATLPFHIVCTLVFAGIWYGMAGLRPTAAAFGKRAGVLTVFHLIACQVMVLTG